MKSKEAGIRKNKLMQKWVELTEDDLQYIEGKEDKLLGRVQAKAGKKPAAY